MIVLDTQAWLWWMHQPERLSKRAIRAIEEAEASQGMLVSTMSVWEVAAKCQIGKLELPLEIHEWYKKASSYPHIATSGRNQKGLREARELMGNGLKERRAIREHRRRGEKLIHNRLSTG